MIGGLFVGVTFSLALPKEQPNKVIKLLLTEIEDSLHTDARVQLHEAYEDKEVPLVKQGDYFLTYYVEGLRPEYTKERIDKLANRLSMLAKDKVHGCIENPYLELRLTV